MPTQLTTCGKCSNATWCKVSLNTPKMMWCRYVLIQHLKFTVAASEKFELAFPLDRVAGFASSRMHGTSSPFPGMLECCRLSVTACNCVVPHQKVPAASWYFSRNISNSKFLLLATTPQHWSCQLLHTVTHASVHCFMICVWSGELERCVTTGNPGNFTAASSTGQVCWCVVEVLIM